MNGKAAMTCFKCKLDQLKNQNVFETCSLSGYSSQQYMKCYAHKTAPPIITGSHPPLDLEETLVWLNNHYVLYRTKEKLYG